MTDTKPDKKTELYLTLNNAMEEVTRLRRVGSTCPLADVLDIHDKLVATLMTIRDITGELAELDSERAICLWLLQDQVAGEIVKLTQVAKAATASVA
jgi:hypothetical protein